MQLLLLILCLINTYICAMKIKIILTFLTTGFLFFGNSCKDDESLDPLPYKGDSTISLVFNAQMNGANLDFDKTDYVTSGGDTIGFSKMKLLMSNIYFKDHKGTWNKQEDAYGYVDLVADTRVVEIKGVPFGTITGVEFELGLDSAVNYGDPNDWAADHPLNPLINGMHWSWAGGYQFNSIEGNYMNNGSPGVYSYHVSTPKYARTFTFTFTDFMHDADESINFNLNADEYFKDPNTLSIKNDGDLSHSAVIDPLMDKFIANTYNLFEFTGVDE